MKKILCFLVAVLTMVTFFTGCKKSDPTVKYDYNMDDYVTLGKYKGVEVEIGSLKIQSLLNCQYRKDMDTLNLVKSSTDLKAGKVENLDTVHITFLGKIDGVPFEGGDSGEAGSDLIIGSGGFIPGFEDGLIGVELGKSKDIAVTFPAVYPQKEDLAGKKAIFTTKVQKITRKTYPELTDEIAKNLNAANLVEYKASVLSTVKKDYVWDKVVQGSKFKYPKKELDSFVSDAKEYYSSQAATNSQTFDALLSSNNINMEKFESIMKDQGKSKITDELVVYAIAQKEKLTITDTELEKGMKDRPNQDGSAYTDKDKAELKTSLLKDKVVKLVTDKAIDA